MRAGLDPFSFLVFSIAGWINQRQQQVIEYLVAENRVLREQIADAAGKIGAFVLLRRRTTLQANGNDLDSQVHDVLAQLTTAYISCSSIQPRQSCCGPHQRRKR